MALTLEQIKMAVLNIPPGILPKNTKFESYMGHNVTNVANLQLSEDQLQLHLTNHKSGKSSTEDWDIRSYSNIIKIILN